MVPGYTLSQKAGGALGFFLSSSLPCGGSDFWSETPRWFSVHSSRGLSLGLALLAQSVVPLELPPSGLTLPLYMNSCSVISQSVPLHFLSLQK